MSRAPQRKSFIVPPPASGPPLAPKPTREPGPFVIVPAALGADDRDTLEPHWHPAIDAATD